MHRPVGHRAQQHLLGEFVLLGGRVGRQARVEAFEADVGDHAEEGLAGLAAQDHVAPDRQILQHRLRMKFDGQPFGQRSADDHPERMPRGRKRRAVEGFIEFVIGHCVTSFVSRTTDYPESKTDYTEKI